MATTTGVIGVLQAVTRLCAEAEVPTAADVRSDLLVSLFAARIEIDALADRVERMDGINGTPVRPSSPPPAPTPPPKPPADPKGK